jgi:aminoglycoside phosphotransferase (APT) family kinase protein
MPGTSLPGFFDRAALAERYAAGSGRDISELGYYVAFAYWRLACILEGVYVRYAAGAMGGDVSHASAIGDQVSRRAEAALEILRG